MGRYYSGDIDGKFWFAVQSSDAADRFGIIGHQPSVIFYSYGEEDLEGVETEIKAIEDALGDKIKTIDGFFKNNNGYNDQMLSEIGITGDDLSEYADLELGKKIRDCIIKEGSCNFEAEC
jgi:hypothetical protein